MTNSSYFVYCIECENGHIYTGITTDVNKRWQTHLAGKGAKYTRAFPPKRLLISWEVQEGKSKALTIESRFKKLPKKLKTTYISSAPTTKQLEKLILS